jgi:hypothetical protein
MLSVCSPLDVAALRAGFVRACGRRDADLLPPLDVLAKLFAADGTFVVDGRRRVRASAPLDWRQELGKNDRIFVDVFRAAGDGILDRAAFHDACVTNGMSGYMFNNATRVSAILDKPLPGAWCLRGTRVNPSAAEALRRTRAGHRGDRRVLAYGRRGDSVIWLRATLPRKRGASLVIRIPAEVAPHVIGRRFTACTENRRPIGAVAVNESGASWGYEPFLSGSNACEGDTLLVEFDLERQSARIKLERL